MGSKLSQTEELQKEGNCSKYLDIQKLDQYISIVKQDNQLPNVQNQGKSANDGIRAEGGDGHDTETGERGDHNLSIMYEVHLEYMDIYEDDLQKVIEKLEKDAKHDKVMKMALKHNNLSMLPENFCKLSSLQSLDLSENHFDSFPMVLTKCRLLAELDFCKNKFSSVDSFPLMDKLLSLRIGINPITNLSEFSRFPNLKKLFIFELPITSLKGLPDSLSHLTQLDIDNCKVSNFKYLPNYSQLEWLQARSNKITTLEDLPNLPKLKYMFIPDNQLISLDGIPLLPSLERIILVENKKLVNIEGVKNLPSLKVITLDKTGLESLHHLTPLKSLKTLERISAIGILDPNIVKDEEKDEFCKVFPNLDSIVW